MEPVRTFRAIVSAAAILAAAVWAGPAWAGFLPNGDLVLLERRYAPAWSIAMRLRRIPGDTVKVGALLDGDILLDAGMTSQIDNMEGLAVSEDEAGRAILTLVSDDNYSVLQRTLVLQFALVED